jgi:hypothetical protein
MARCISRLESWGNMSSTVPAASFGAHLKNDIKFPPATPAIGTLSGPICIDWSQ